MVESGSTDKVVAMLANSLGPITVAIGLYEIVGCDGGMMEAYITKQWVNVVCVA